VRSLLFRIVILLLVGAVAAGHGRTAASRQPQATWQTGYWLWQMAGYPAPAPTGKVDLLYVQVGEFFADSSWTRKRSSVWSPRLANKDIDAKLANIPEWPRHLPKADSYIAVWRNTSATTPGAGLVDQLIERYQHVKRQAAQAGQRLIGLQIDHDCPTADLDTYAHFLKALRTALPQEDLISITALLDWFRSGTQIAHVLQWVNEHIPQFYDIETSSAETNSAAIAAVLDPKKWAPIFNAYGRPYRIGIATFGRIAWLRPESHQSIMGRFFRDLSPFDVTGQRGLRKIIEQRHNNGELVLRYEATQDVPLAGHLVGAGDVIEIVLPSQESVRSVYQAAHALGGFCTGVVFFRWPQEEESLVLTPREVENLLAEKGSILLPHQLEAKDGDCAVVGCTDLFLLLGNRYPRQPLSLQITTSSPIEYILPAERVQIRAQGPQTLTVQLPAYAGIPKLYLGRVMTRDQAYFKLR
jgi:hypothetical protein